MLPILYSVACDTLWKTTGELRILNARQGIICEFILVAIALLHAFPVAAGDSSWLKVDFSLRGIAQNGKYSNAFNENQNEIDNRTHGATIADLDITYAPTRDDTFFAQLRYANGNSLNNVGGMAFSPYGGDLEDQVTDIGGRDRDYLREAWYRHDFRFSNDSSFAVTAGLIDATNYIATNAYFGDEDTQFMNQVFSNNLTSQLPSYDPGGVISFESGGWSFNGVYMTPKTVSGKTYDYFVVQFRLHRQSQWGDGNYNVFAFTTSSELLNAEKSDNDARLKGIGMSFDQELGPVLGVFAEVGFQDNEASILFDQIVTFGVSLDGVLWDRPGDEAGIAFGRANGESNGMRDTSVDHGTIAEAYIRLRLTDSSNIGLDLQYMQDSLNGSGEIDDPELIVIGLRFNSTFGF
jgi:hypothetical protein